MTEYVVGFLFDDLPSKVVLIQKKRPRWQSGRLNGVGGKIEPGETPEQAMVREFREEAGADTSGLWVHYSTLIVPTQAKVYFFRASSTKALRETRTASDEPIVFANLEEIARLSTIPNLQWLIPMALHIHEDSADAFTITEEYQAA